MTDAERYLAKARESLASAETDLAARRYNSVANRAYYAAFQAAVAALITTGVLASEASWRHRFVMNQFSGRLIRRRKLVTSSLASTLNQLFDYRTTGDYRAADVSAREARHAVKLAKRMLNESSGLSRSGSVREVRAEYESDEVKSTEAIKTRARELLGELQDAILSLYPEAEFEVVDFGPKDYRLIVRTDVADLVDIHEVLGDRASDMLVDHDIWVVVLTEPKAKRVA